MKYSFDSGPLINLKYYFPQVFKSLWGQFEILVEQGDIVCARDVYNELINRGDSISDWVKSNSNIFLTPSAEEIKIVSEILAKHPELIRKKSIQGGMPVADPFVIAQAEVNNLIVVTSEKFQPDAHKIPNICKERNIVCLLPEDFMQKEGWEF